MVHMLHCIYLLLLVLLPTLSASQSVNDILITVNQNACRCTPTLFVEILTSCSRSYFRQKTGYLLYIAWFAIMPNETSYSIHDICCACTRKTSHDVINCFIFELLASFTPVEPTHVIFACLFYVLIVVNLYIVMFIY